MPTSPYNPHVPVLADEVVEQLAPRSGGVYCDGTVGAGGHAERVLEAGAPDARLIGIDRDPAALAIARERLARFAARVTLVHAHLRRRRARAGRPRRRSGRRLPARRRSVVDPARRRRARLLVRAPGPDRHAHGSDGDDPTALELIRRARRRGAVAHPARPGRGALPQAHRASAQGGGARRPPAHHRRPGPRGRGVHPGAGAAADAHPPGHADLPGPAHRGQPRARAARALPRSLPRPARAPAAAASSSASTRSRTAW